MDDNLRTILFTLVIPGVVAFLSTWIIDTLRFQKEIPKRRAELVAEWQTIAIKATRQLAIARAEISELREGIAILLKVFTEKGLKIPWRPNGSQLDPEEE